MSYDAKVLALSPVAYWPMQETSGTLMTALVGSNGTYHGGVTLGVGGPSADCLPRGVATLSLRTTGSPPCRST